LNDIEDFLTSNVCCCRQRYLGGGTFAAGAGLRGEGFAGGEEFAEVQGLLKAKGLLEAEMDLASLSRLESSK
jgi:hypothetical protein